jgi:carboxymethylenebutenolidase
MLKALPTSNSKAGVIGMCSGGRHAFLAACSCEGIDAAVDCWGGSVVMAPERLSPKQPVAPIDLTEKLKAPLLGIFGNDDKFPTPEEVDQHEAALKKYGKDYEFHRYDGCGHGFWYYHSPMYRPEQAMESWEIVFQVFKKRLS